MRKKSIKENTNEKALTQDPMVEQSAVRKGGAFLNFFRKKQTKIVSLILAALLMISGSFTIGYFSSHWAMSDRNKTVIWTMDMIDKYYYSEEDGQIVKFSGADYAKAITEKLLDQYSGYYTNEEYEEILETNRGNSYGVGISYLKTQNDTTIYRVTWNSPADKAGLIVGDTITSAKTSDGTVSEFNLKEEVFSFFSSRKEGEKFTLYFTRNGEEKSVELSREIFVTSYIVYYDKEIKGAFRSEGKANPVLTILEEEGMTELAEDTAYIGFSLFEGQTNWEIDQAFNLLKERGKTKVILDLRGNGGGSMDILEHVASHFIGNESLPIAYTIDKNGDEKVYSSRAGKFNEGISKFVVLANEYTASASECLLGAMLYYGKGFGITNLVIEKNGESAHTYGKGIVQTSYRNYSTGEAIKLTSAKLYQPDKTTCIHGTGIIAIPENAVEKGNAAINRAIAILAS